MNLRFTRGLLRGALVLAFAAVTTATGATAAQAAAPRLSLTALAFEQPTVDASAGTAIDNLTWTIKNTDPDAENLFGSVTFRMRSSVTGAYVGHEKTVQFSYGDTCCNGASWVSGTPQESTYEYSLGVPRWADATTTTWEVTNVSATTNGLTLSVGRAKLADFASTVTATTSIDSSGPSVETLTLQRPSPPYLYVGDGSREVTYDFGVQDAQSGFWKGTLKLAGPGGQSVSTPFTWEYEEYSTGTRCGSVSGGDLWYMSCNISVTLPAGAAAGSWRLAQMVVFNNVGGRSTFKNPQSSPFTVTSNAVVSASNFAISPAEADNWREDVEGEVTFDVAGLRKGLSSVNLEFGPYGRCRQDGPASLSGSTVTAEFVMFERSTDCTVTGLAIVDGAGAVAVYGSDYGAPDPKLTVRRKPNTTPPSITGATLDPSVVALSQIGDRALHLEIKAKVQTAPINQYSVRVYNAEGDTVYQVFGGTGQQSDGTVDSYIYLSPWEVQPGTYTVGFRLTDESGLSTSWDLPDYPNSQPVPGGPVTLTVTAD
ncbi:hypothetical protein OWR29_26935 [Actinoplanes sp. Pm04-4]|uniref:Uncharacterized protein n=1 Tax=Paractinoplanes pyxinae TaxID=2997416 RepID=A0ABT4B581_9ACTN|nr:hypothetical protein [Actinoplanes pyxinae]MCY1141648.1 hypothetical protein [Actinoplanes pyxinae]